MGKSATDVLNELFKSINSSFWPAYLLAVSGLGTLTMAVLQTLKNTTPICRWFQRWQMLRFLKAHAAIATANFGETVNYDTAELDIILLATDGDANAFYELEIEKLCGQWNSAIQIAIDSPSLYPAFLACVAARANKQDYFKLKNRDLPEPIPPHVETELGAEDQKLRLHRRQEFIDARTRVTHQIQRAVDAFQIATAYRWKWQLQIASFLMSFSFAALAMLKSSAIRFSFTKALLWALIAGFLAPVASDLLAGIEKLRDPF